jgi:3-oxoadipate enol-lactonase
MTQTVRVNDVDIAYQWDGLASGPVVVLSNSLMSNLNMWDDTIGALTDTYRVLRYDTRGHGRSGVTPGPYSIESLSKDLVGLLDALKVSKAHVVGLSMGGMTAQYVGANFPERVLSLGLCNTASEMPPRSTWAARIESAQQSGIAALVDGTIQRWFREGFTQRSPEKITAVRKMILATPVEGYIANASAVRDMAQTTMLLKIKAPTLVMTGRQDPACTVDQGTVLHRMIDGSKFVIIEDAAHLSNIEQPEVFNRNLRAFLDSVPA